jgi:hypothetical protein
MVGSVSLKWIIPGSFDGSQELCPLLLALYRLQRNLRASCSNLRRPKGQNTRLGGDDGSTLCLPVRIRQKPPFDTKLFLCLHNLRHDGSNFVAQSTRTPANTENRRDTTLSERRKVNGAQDMEIVPCGTKRSARCRFLVGRSPRPGAMVTQALAQTFTSVESQIVWSRRFRRVL